MMITLVRYKLILVALIAACALVAVCAVLGALTYKTAGVVVIVLAAVWKIGDVLWTSRSLIGGRDDVRSLREMRRGQVTAFQRWDSATRLKAKSIPWVLLLGAPGSGKSQLSSAGGRSAHVNIDIQIPSPHDGGTLPVRYVLHTYGVTVDCPGRIGLGEEAEDETWQLLLREVEAFRGTVAPINGVGLVVGVDELLTDPVAAANAIRVAAWRRRLTQLHEVTQHYVPIYIIITKLDLIGGFESLFGATGRDGVRNIALGWSNQKTPSVEFDAKGLTDGLAQLQATVSEFARNMQAVHQNHSDRAEATPRIAEVELAAATLGTLVERVTVMVNSLFGDNRQSALPVFLRGVYFTAAAPDEERVVRFTASESEWSQLAVTDRASRTVAVPNPILRKEPVASYFVRDLWETKIFKEHGLACTDSAGRMHLVRAKFVALLSATTVAAAFLVAGMFMFLSSWQQRQGEPLRHATGIGSLPPAVSPDGSLVACLSPESAARLTLVEWQHRLSGGPRQVGQVPLALAESGLPFELTPVAATRGWVRTRLLVPEAGGYSAIPREGVDPLAAWAIPSAAARDGRIREWKSWDRRSEKEVRTYQVSRLEAGAVRSREFEAPSPAWFEATAFVSTTLAPIGCTGSLAGDKTPTAATWEVWGLPKRLDVAGSVELAPPAKLSIRASCVIDTAVDGKIMIGAACFSDAPPEAVVKPELFSESHFGVIWIDGVGLTSELLLPTVAGSEPTTTHRRFVPLGLSSSGEVVVGCVLTKGAEKLNREAGIAWIQRRGAGEASIRIYSVRELLAARAGDQAKQQCVEFDSWNDSEAWDISEDGRVVVGRASLGQERRVWTLRLGLSESP